MAEEFTQLLLAWGNGDEAAREQLFPLIYEELHRLAHHFMRGERAGQTMQTTALVHDAYLRLVTVDHVQSKNRQQFFALAATAMRRVLIDVARERSALRRGNHPQQVSLNEAMVAPGNNLLEMMAIDEAFEKFANKHPRQAQVFEMKYFGGYEGKEIAELLGVAPATVTGDWNFAKLWMKEALQLKQ